MEQRYYDLGKMLATTIGELCKTAGHENGFVRRGITFEGGRVVLFIANTDAVAEVFENAANRAFQIVSETIIDPRETKDAPCETIDATPDPKHAPCRPPEVYALVRPVDQKWHEFSRNLMLTGEQRTDMRRAFYGGASALLYVVLGGLSNGPDATAEDYTVMDRIQGDLDRFVADAKAGLE